MISGHAAANSGSAGWASGLSIREIAGRGALVFMGMIALVTSVICAIDSIRWVGRIFPGFTLNARMVLDGTGRYDWTGVRAGLKYPDRVVKANGRDLPTLAALMDILANAREGEAILYTVEKEGRTVELAIPTMRFTVSDLFLTCGILFICGLVYMIIGIIVFTMKPGTPVSWSFLLSSFFLSIYTIISSGIDSMHNPFLMALYLFVLTMVPAGFVHLSLVFPEPRKIVSKHNVVQVLPYGIAIALLLPFEMLYPKPPSVIVACLVKAYMFLAAVLVMISSVRPFFRASSPIARQRARVVLLGAAVAFPIPAMGELLPALGDTFSQWTLQVQKNFLAIPLTFFPISIAYAIVKHNLFDVDLYVRRAVGYAVMTLFVGAGFFSMQVMVRALILEPLFGEYSENIYPILFSLLVVFLFNPVRNRLQRVIDRIFYRLEYNYQATVQKISETMRSLLNLDQIVHHIMSVALDTMFVDSGRFFLLNRQRPAFECLLASGAREEGFHPRGENIDVSGGEEAGREPSRVGGRPETVAPSPEDLGSRAGSDGHTVAAAPLSPGLALAADDPLVRILAARKRPLTLYDVLEDPLLEDSRDDCRGTLRRLEATLIVPILLKDELIGLIALGQKKSGNFYKREDINLLNFLADQGAVAVRNAQLVGEVIEKERMEEELAIARDLQMSMMPAGCPQISGFELAAFLEPAREVGGDFYDFIEMPGETLGLVVGDVTGKSVSGALVTAAARSIFRTLSEQGLGLSEIMTRANRQTKRDIASGMFVALLMAVIDGRERVLRISSAGQTQPVYFDGETGKATLLETEGDTIPLGILDEVEYLETRLRLASGDAVVFYTDGVVETMNAQGEIFGFERLLRTLEDSGCAGAERILGSIVERVNKFAGGAARHDDLTIIVLSVCGEPR